MCLKSFEDGSLNSLKLFILIFSLCFNCSWQLSRLCQMLSSILLPMDSSTHNIYSWSIFFKIIFFIFNFHLDPVFCILVISNLITAKIIESLKRWTLSHYGSSIPHYFWLLITVSGSGINVVSLYFYIFSYKHMRFLSTCGYHFFHVPVLHHAVQI